MNTTDVNKTNQEVVAMCCCCAPSRVWAAFWGIVLISLGGLSLVNTVIPLQNVGRYILPAFLILWGGFILFNLRRTRTI